MGFRRPSWRPTTISSNWPTLPSQENPTWIRCRKRQAESREADRVRPRHLQTQPGHQTYSVSPRLFSQNCFEKHGQGKGCSRCERKDRCRDAPARCKISVWWCGHEGRWAYHFGGVFWNMFARRFDCEPRGADSKRKRLVHLRVDAVEMSEGYSSVRSEKWRRSQVDANPATNPHDETKSTNLRTQFHLDRSPPKGWLSW